MSAARAPHSRPPERRRAARPAARPAARALAALALLLAAGTASAQGGEPAAPTAPSGRAPGTAPPARPNLVLVLADDLGWNDVGYHGSRVETPTLDRLAAEGVRLEQFYVLQECTPTRAALLTGRHPVRYGLQEGVFWAWTRVGLPLEERTLAEALRAAGYRTAIIGKWHLGHHEPAYRPRARGFDRQYGMYTGIIDHFQHRYYEGIDWRRDGEPLREEGWATTLMGREAARLIDEHDFDARPLFLYFAPFAPHAPPQPPPEHAHRYDTVFASEMRRKYAATVTGMDDAIGAVVAALERRGVRDRTLIVFASDNGGDPALGASNDPLRGGKDDLWEGGVRVPALAVWPGVLPAGAAVDVPIHVTDLYPTLLARAGVAPDADPERPLDGLDAWPAIARGEPLPREEMLINVMGRQSALRAGDWKIVRSTGPAGLSVELFDLSRDPGEKRDLSRRRPDELDELSARLLRWQQQVVRPLGPYPERLPLGYRVPAFWGD